MTLGRCPLSIVCSRGTPTNSESITACSLMRKHTVPARFRQHKAHPRYAPVNLTQRRWTTCQLNNAPPDHLSRARATLDGTCTLTSSGSGGAPCVSDGESCTDRYSSQFKNNYFTEMCSGSEEGSYLMLIDFCITQL